MADCFVVNGLVFSRSRNPLQSFGKILVIDFRPIPF
jgi:hypothetical protein